MFNRMPIHSREIKFHAANSLLKHFMTFMMITMMMMTTTTM